MKLKKRKWINVVTAIVSVCLVIFVNPLYTDAWWWSEEDTTDIVKFLQGHSDWLNYGSFFSVILHELGWILIKGLYNIASFLEGLIPQSLGLLDFLDDAGLEGITKAIINDLVVVLMVLTLVYIGFKTVIAKEPPNFKSVGVNIFISAFLILGMPTLMDTMEDISVKFYEATQTGDSGQVSSLSWSLIQDNTADLVYVADNGFDLISNGSTNTVKNALTPDIFKAVNLSELLTPEAIDDLETDNEDLKSLKYTLSSDGQGGYTALKIDGGLLSFFSDSFDPGYFRYPAKFIPIMVGLGALSVAYLFTLFVFATTIVEIGIKRVVGLFVFATDLESGQRTKKVVQDILNAFMLIAFTGLALKMYTIFLTFLGTQDINIVIYIIALISATFVLIKGSNTIMRYFGVDTGLKEGFGQLAGAFALGKSFSGLARKPLKHQSHRNKENPKDNLPNQGDNDPKSINDQKKNGNSGLKDKINSAGKTLGFMKNRGLSGMTEDAIKGTGEKLANGFKQKGKSISDYMSGIKGSWNEGVAQGKAIGESNKQKWDGKQKSVNDSGNAIEPLNNENSSFKNGLHQASGNGQLRTTGEDSIQSKNSVNGAPNALTNQSNSPTLQESKQTNGTGKSSEKVLGQMRFEDAMTANKNGTSNKGTTTARQMVTQDIQPISNSNGSVARQQVSQDVQLPTVSAPQQTTQRIRQQVDKVGYGNTDQIKQKVIQEVQQSATGNTEVKQRVVQQLDQANSATPQQVTQNVTQNVQEVLSSTSVPEGVPSSVQKVKQVVETTENQVAATHTEENKSKYFGSLFGETLDSYENKEKPKKSSRFDFIKKL